MSAVGQVDGAAGRYENSRVNKAGDYGNTIGDVKLSDKGAKYYEELKKKYSDMDFVLVSNDEVNGAEQKAAKYANPDRTLVLIDEDKIEKMAEDENYRKKYEDIIGNADAQLDQMKQKLAGGTLASVKTFGIKVDDSGNSSYFAVVDKSLAAQKERIADSHEKRAEERKAADKKASAERLEHSREKFKTNGRGSGEDLETISGSTVDELLKKLNDSYYAGLSDRARTEQEKMLGTNMDFKL